MVGDARHLSQPLQEDRLTCLPTDVLLILCRAVQLQAVTPPNMRVNHAYKYGRDSVEVNYWTPAPAFKALRLSCKVLRSASDHARTSISFSVDDQTEAVPFLRTLPSINSVTVLCDNESGVISSCLAALHSVVPALESLTWM